MEESVKSRTIEFVKAKGIKMKVFEERCGLSSGYVTSMRKGFGPDKLTGVLKAFPELNRNWLLYGEGKMLSGDDVFCQPHSDYKFKSIFSMPSDWLHPLAAQKASSLAFASSLTLTDSVILLPCVGFRPAFSRFPPHGVFSFTIFFIIL